MQRSLKMQMRFDFTLFQGPLHLTPVRFSVCALPDHIDREHDDENQDEEKNIDHDRHEDFHRHCIRQEKPERRSVRHPYPCSSL